MANLIYKFPNAEEGTEEYISQCAQLTRATGTTRLGIEADFQSLFTNYTMTGGKYGFKVIVTGESKTTDTIGESQIIVRQGEFTTDDMYGNPYLYVLPYTQQKLFDISEFLKLTSVEIYFYQDWDFVDVSGSRIPYMDTTISYKELAYDDYGNQIFDLEHKPVYTTSYDYLPDNIFISNLSIYAGFSADELDTDKVFLYTYDDVIYGRNPEVVTPEERAALDSRDLHIIWVHKTETGFEVIDEPKELPWHYEYKDVLTEEEYKAQLATLQTQYNADIEDIRTAYHYELDSRNITEMTDPKEFAAITSKYMAQIQVRAGEYQSAVNLLQYSYLYPQASEEIKDAEIHWYKYVLDTNKTDKYGGVNWELINNLKTYSVPLDPESDEYQLAQGTFEARRLQLNSQLDQGIIT